MDSPDRGSSADEQEQVPGLHEALAPLAFLVGTWRGVGVGGYPTIEDFRYEEEIVFSHDGRPFLQYSSRTWVVAEDGTRLRPSGSEVGWWRMGAAPREVEVMLAHHTGIVEIYLGEVVFHKVEIATDVVARTSTAKDVAALKRLYGLVEGDLAYAVDLAAVGHPLTAHLSNRLTRDPVAATG